MDPAKLLKTYQEKGYNILTPYVSLDGLSARWKATVKTTYLSSNIKDGDVYPKKGESGSFIITKQGLERLSVLANIIWNKSQRLDDEKNKKYIKMEAHGALRLADGSLSPDNRSYGIDLEARAELLRYEYIARGKKLNKSGQVLDDYVDFCVGERIAYIRNHMDTLCETGAKNRVIRALLGIKTYTKAQLNNPFVCVTIAYTPDEEDPLVRELLTLQSMGALSQVYGMSQSPRLPAPTPKQVEYVATDEEAELIPEDDELIPEEDEIIPDENNIPEDDFNLWDRKSREAYVDKLSKTKGYDLKGLLGRMKVNSLADLNDTRLKRIKENLEPMKDDDIPF